MTVAEYLKEYQSDFEDFLIVDRLKSIIFYYGSNPLAEAEKEYLDSKIYGISRVREKLLELVV